MTTFAPLRGILATMTGGGMAVNQDEEGLIERARGGDRSAFDDLVRAHLTRVWNVVWRILRHREDTEDVVQEVFLAAYRALPRFRGEASLSTWLQRIAVTRALNHRDLASERMRRASRPIDERQGGTGGVAGREGTTPIPASTVPSPLQALEANELRRRLSECLDRLPAAWRAVLALRDAEENSYQQIAVLLSVALGTVRSRLARARLALRRCVEGER